LAVATRYNVQAVTHHAFNCPPVRTARFCVDPFIDIVL
jgi:hypothetical protein